MKRAVTILLLFISFVSNAQDPQFSQYYASPLYLNPALAGNTEQGRFSGIYRNQWPAIPKAYISYVFSYDHNFSDYNSGLGFVAIHDKAGTAGLKYNSFGLSYSYQLRLGRKLVLRPGLRASYVSRSLDFGSLKFATDVAPVGSNINAPVDNFNRNVRYLDLAAGLVFYSSKFWVGFAFDHINKPNESLISGNVTRLPSKFNAHGGYNFPISKDSKGHAKSTITATAIYKAQLKWDQLDVGAYYTQEPIIVGVWYRGLPLIKSHEGNANNDAASIMAGVKVKDLRIAYSYDITISRLAANTGGAHEVSLIWEYVTAHKRKKRRRQKFLVPCAKF